MRMRPVSETIRRGGVDELERHPLVPLVPGVAIVATGYAVASLGRVLEAPTDLSA